MKIINQLKNMRNLEASPEEEMKQFILSLASELNLDEGHVLPARTLIHRSFHLNPKQRDALVPALESLIEDGIFEEKNDSVFLTSKGKDVLY